MAGVQRPRAPPRAQRPRSQRRNGAAGAGAAAQNAGAVAIRLRLGANMFVKITDRVMELSCYC